MRRIVLTLLLMLAAWPAWAQLTTLGAGGPKPSGAATPSIAFNAAADLGNNGGSTSSLTHSYTVSSGSNRLLVVVVQALTTDDITGITYAGTSMTKVGTTFTPTGGSTFEYFYYLLNPASGANNVVISASTSHYLIAGAADYTGVQQSAQPDAHTTHDSGGGSVSSLTTSLTSVANNSWGILGSFCDQSSSSQIAGTGATQRAIDGTFGGRWAIYDTNAPITPAGSFSMQTTQTASIMGAILVSFVP